MPLVRPPSSKAREAEGPLRLPRTPRPCSAWHAKLQFPPKDDDDVDEQATTAKHQPLTTNRQQLTTNRQQPPTQLSSTCPPVLFDTRGPASLARLVPGSTPLLGVPPPSPPIGRADTPSAHQRDRSRIFYIRSRCREDVVLEAPQNKGEGRSSSFFFRFWR